MIPAIFFSFPNLSELFVHETFSLFQIPVCHLPPRRLGLKEIERRRKMTGTRPLTINRLILLSLTQQRLPSVPLRKRKDCSLLTSQMELLRAAKGQRPLLLKQLSTIPCIPSFCPRWPAEGT